MKLEFIIENAVEQGFDSQIVHAALVDANVDAIEIFIKQLNQSVANSLRREVLRHLISMARSKEEEKALAMLGRALEISHGEVVHIIAELSRIDSEQALALIRRAVRAKRESLRDHAASAIIHVQYGDDAELALQDEEELVRHVAVKQLEKQENATALIAALRNDSTGVRRVAAWYMGRKGVNQATDVLIEQVQGENDIEALRAAIWSLGMLHDTRAVPYLRKLSKHPNRLIATTAQESASRLGK